MIPGPVDWIWTTAYTVMIAGGTIAFDHGLRVVRRRRAEACTTAGDMANWDDRRLELTAELEGVVAEVDDPLAKAVIPFLVESRVSRERLSRGGS